MRRLAALAVPLGVALVTNGAFVQVTEGQERRRTLFLALDAVSFDIVEAMTRPDGETTPLFRHLRGPVPVVSSFPSATTVAFTGFFEPLGLERPPGYEARFFDLEAKKMRGGGLRSYNKIKFSWREFFDWRVESIVRKNIGFVRPVRFGQREIRRALEEFFASDREQFFAYIAGTDGAGHLKGPEGIGRILSGLDAALAEARATHPPHTTVVFSDHGISGGEPLVNVRRSVKQAARGAGFHVGKRIRSVDDLVIVSFGLLSSVVLYAAEGEAERAAAAVASAEGVALCATETGPDSWRLFDGRGSARIGRRQSAGRLQFSYVQEGADPLEYGPVLAMLEGARVASGGGLWLDDRRWFEATVAARYPDGPYRIARAFDLVRNPASAVCSVAPGYMFGGWFADWSSRVFMGRLRWTHGSLERQESLGFLMTDHPGWNGTEALRFDTSLVPYLTPADTQRRLAAAAAHE